MKKVNSIRYELLKMWDGGHTHEQMQDFVKKCLESGDVTMDDVVEALVYSRWNEIYLNNKLAKIQKAVFEI